MCPRLMVFEKAFRGGVDLRRSCLAECARRRRFGRGAQAPGAAADHAVLLGIVNF